jgi:hypothetical protein
MRLIGIILAILLLIVLTTWLRSEGPKLFGGGTIATSTDQVQGWHFTTTSTGIFSSGRTGSTSITSNRSVYADKVTIVSVKTSPQKALTMQNQGKTSISLGGWSLLGKNGALPIPNGIPQNGSVVGDGNGTILRPGETFILFDGARSALQPISNASWYAWAGKQYFVNHDMITLFDKEGKAVARYTY